MKNLFSIVFSFLFLSLSAQVLKPIKWEISKEKISDDEYYLVFKANITKGWTVYSQFTSDEGPVPTEIVYESKAGVELIGKGQESGYKKEGPDPLFDDVNVIKYLDKQPFVIKQKIKVKDWSKPLSGYLTFMTCDSERCLPPDDVDFSIKFDKPAGGTLVVPTPSTSSTAIKEVVKDPKKEIATTTPTTTTATTNTKETVTVGNTTVLPIEEATDTVQEISTTQETIVNTTSVFKSSAKIENGVIDQLIASLNTTFKSPRVKCDDNGEVNKGYFWTFFFGFMGGLFALLTPCVFPMIPITVSFFTKDTKRKGWMNGLIYGISIITIYVVLGLLITAIFGPEALNRLSTNWIANTLFFIIFIFFAFSFFGFYEITLPSSWSTKSDQMADKGGLIGIFFMAFTLALVSFSCTGPIIGSALVSAASKGEYLGPFLVMFGFSLALALPFGLFAAFPSWLNSLPKSGSWMNSVKVVLGFLELALALKFLSVADMTNHWGVLKYELFLGLWIIVFFAMALYLFGFIKFPHDSPLKKLSLTRKGFGILAAVSCIYLMTGFTTNKKTNNYNALALMSGLAPPANYNFFKPNQEVNADIKAKYPSFTKCANNIDCFKDYYEGLAFAKENNKPILLDFTGYGCVNCRKTEEHIWVNDNIRTKLNDEMVLISLYVDDDKKLIETLVSKQSNKKIRNVGNMWSDFQIANFEQNSQPLYIVVDPKDESVVAAPRGYKEGVEDYRKYLDCALTGIK
jgi:thiol:disulfide interchange protein